MLAQPVAPRKVKGPGATMAGAMDLGSVSTSRTVQQTLAAGAGTQFYRFKASSQGNFNAWLSGLAGGTLQVLNSKRQALSGASKAAGRWASVKLQPGTYYIRISGSPARTDRAYKLRVQDDLNYGTVSLGGQHRAISLTFVNGSTAAINPKKDVWVVIHGWGSSPQGFEIHRLGEALAEAPANGQILQLDWSAEADEANILDAISWVPAVAQWTANTLGRWGLSTSHINIAAHSLGGWVTNDLAADVSGGVNRIIAIDPATDPTGFLDAPDYTGNSRYSVAFEASSFATPSAVESAHESFKVNVGPFDSIISHSNVVDLVAWMVTENNSGQPDAISKLFSLSSLSPSVNHAWKEDAFSGGIEGTITGQFTGGFWKPKTLVYKSAANGKTVMVQG